MPQQLFPWVHHDQLSQDSCIHLLAPHFDVFSGALFGAWNRWMDSIHPDTRADISTMQRGGVIYDLACARARVLIATQEGLEPCDELGFFKVYVQDQLVVRFKKLRNDYSVNLSGATDQCREFYHNSDLSGIRGHCQRLTCGYILDAAEEEIADIAITCQFGETILWNVSIIDSGYSFDSANDGHDSLPAQPTIVPIVSGQAVEA